MSFNNVGIVYVKGNAYRIHFWYMSKDDARGVYNFFFIIYRMSEYADLTYYQKKKKREVILNRVKDYYEIDKERLKRQARDKYRNLS